MRKPRPEISKNLAKIKAKCQGQGMTTALITVTTELFQVIHLCIFLKCLPSTQHWSRVVRKTLSTHEVDGLWTVTVHFHSLIYVALVYRSVCPLAKRLPETGATLHSSIYSPQDTAQSNGRKSNYTSDEIIVLILLLKGI